MGTVNFIWNLTKNYFTFGLIGLTISDRYASIVPVGGISMSPTFNQHDDSSMRSLTRNYFFLYFKFLKFHAATWMKLSASHYGEGDFVVVEKLCLEKYKFPSAM